MELYGPLARERGVVLETRIAPGIAVRELLAQAIANLVDNAVNFSASGDTVRITVRAGPGTASLAVVDQGPGIPAADR